MKAFMERQVNPESPTNALSPKVEWFGEASWEAETWWQGFVGQSDVGVSGWLAVTPLPTGGM